MAAGVQIKFDSGHSSYLILCRWIPNLDRLGGRRREERRVEPRPTGVEQAIARVFHVVTCYLVTIYARFCRTIAKSELVFHCSICSICSIFGLRVYSTVRTRPAFDSRLATCQPAARMVFK
jgi:hypothetical protein